MDKKDPQIWAIAKKRASFKAHLYSYILVNGFLWAIWFFTTSAEHRMHSTPWPVWPLLGWGIGLAFHFVSAYFIQFDEKVAAEKEYEKLMRQKRDSKKSED